MTMIKTISAVVFASACAFTALTGASQARTTPYRAESPMITGSIAAPAWSVDGLGGRDTDSGNARNPALPGYAQARGQETGGPARELIPNERREASPDVRIRPDRTPGGAMGHAARVIGSW